MLKLAMTALAALMVLSLAALAGGETVVGKLPPNTKIQMWTKSPPSYTLAGDIDPGAEDLFAEIVGDRMGGVLDLRSEGGDVQAALAIGRLVRAHHIQTSARSTCLSACAIIWAAGISRYRGKDAVLGFHHPWHLEDGEIVEGSGPELTAYFKEMGYSEDAIRAFLADPRTFYYLTRDRANDLGVKLYSLDSLD